MCIFISLVGAEVKCLNACIDAYGMWCWHSIDVAPHPSTPLFLFLSSYRSILLFQTLGGILAS
jgi:hypothetical protein